MTDNVVYLHGEPSPVAHYLRVGTSGHRQLETLVSAGRFNLARAVIDASCVNRQRDLLATIAETGCELTLDTNIAELSCEGRFGGAAKSAPWANPNAALTEDDFRRNSNRDLIGQIARFAVSHGFNAVLAPTHLLDAFPDPLFNVDRESTLALRAALDTEGGKQIAIHYPLIIRYASLRDPAHRRAFIAGLRDVPFDSLWFRISGFGSDASAVGLRRYIAAVLDFIRLERPLIADGVGGLAAAAITAFGAAGGICHGVAEKERFDASDWHKPPKPGGGGRERRVLIAGIDRLLSMKQTDALMAVPGARKLLSCGDRTCCPTGLDDTIADPKGHYLHQRLEQIHELAAVPDLRRPAHFLDKQLAVAQRIARGAARLEVPDDAIAALLVRSSERLEKMHPVLDDLRRALSGAPRARPPAPRQGGESAVARRR